VEPDLSDVKNQRALEILLMKKPEFRENTESAMMRQMELSRPLTPDSAPAEKSLIGSQRAVGERS
jgi:hypothetical protein